MGVPLFLQLQHLYLLLVVSYPLECQLQAFLEGEQGLVLLGLFEGGEERVVGFVLCFLRLFLDLRIRESHYWNILKAQLFLTLSLFLKIGISSLNILLFVLLDHH